MNQIPAAGQMTVIGMDSPGHAGDHSGVAYWSAAARTTAAQPYLQPC